VSGATREAPRATGEPYLRGRHAIVTGGGRGIGAAIATELARLGARLTLMGRNAGVAQRHAAALSHEFETDADGVKCDVADPVSVSEAFARARETFGDAYVLVNNAGQAEGASFIETSPELWDQMISVNLTGAYLCTRQVLPAMVAVGGGRIINIASTAGLRGYTRMAAYCAAKHGLIGMTRALAMETAKRGVTVNAVCPSYTDTDMAKRGVDNLVAARSISPEEALKMLTRANPLGRLVTPAEVASAVGWLCSPEASAMTGQSIAVAGGEVM
jgi:NAD(P)-dependent dehydrogenase (short-subunit alcohol dehydrogenase family)